MTDPSTLFRKNAVEKLSSPEQLDVMMQVTSPSGWVALIGLAIVLVFVVIWSIVGKIGIKVDGAGLLMRGAAVLDVTSGTQGRLSEVLVKPGDLIKPGQTVARLDQGELQLRIANTKAQLAQLETQKSEAGTSQGSIVAQYRAQLVELRAKANVQEGLVKRGLLTRSTLLRTKEQIASTETMIAQSRQSASGQEIRVDDLKRQLVEMEAKFASSIEIQSPYAGRVLEVVVGSGGLVSAGGRILTLEPVDAPLELVIYVSGAEGKKITEGMPVRISPATVKQEEYGFMIGSVKHVSDFPVTPEYLRKTLRNDKLVDTMLGKGAPFEVVATLLPDKNTPSGYKWSSSKGPPSPVYSGTLANGSVVVENKTPISYVLPIVKKAIGAS